jgi:hypothetical protein
VDLVHLGSARFSACGVDGIQEDPAAFRVFAGAPLPERTSLPAVRLGLRGLPWELALGAMWVTSATRVDPGLWAIAALALPF